MKVFREGLASAHGDGEAAKALGFELAAAYEAAGAEARRSTTTSA